MRYCKGLFTLDKPAGLAELAHLSGIMHRIGPHCYCIWFDVKSEPARRADAEMCQFPGEICAQWDENSSCNHDEVRSPS